MYYSNNVQKWTIGGIMFYLVLVVLGIIGWVMNIVKLLDMLDQEVTTVTMLFILRCIGIVVAPFGAILGWFF